MPFIDTKVTMPLTEAQKETLKAELGRAISVLNKTETYLMVGLEDDYDLYLGGHKLDKGAYVSVSLYGKGSSASFDRMTGVICDLYQKHLGIPGDAVYVTYHPIDDWGWNGGNF